MRAVIQQPYISMHGDKPKGGNEMEKRAGRKQGAWHSLCPESERFQILFEWVGHGNILN